MTARRAGSPTRRLSGWWRPGARRAALWCAAVTVLLVFATWEGVQSRRSASAHWSVLAVIACSWGVAAVVGRGLQHKSSARWARDGFHAIGGDLRRRSSRGAPMVAGAAVWTTLIVGTVGWDLYSFSRQVHSLPTLSRLIGDVTDQHWGRAIVFAGWLALGTCLVIGWRDRRIDEGAP